MDTVNPSTKFSMGQKFLDNGQTDLAMPYFYAASVDFVELGLWDKAAESYMKSAYCYEFDGRYREAMLDYEMASHYYDKAELSGQCLSSMALANNNKKKYLNDKKVLLVGVVGRNGSGKDEVVKRLRSKFNVPLVSTGDITREIAKEDNIEPTRENLNNISKKYWARYGREFYPGRVVRKIIENNWTVVGWTGIRPPSDVKIIKEFLGDNFFLVNVEVTDLKVRFNRLVKRSEERDPQKYEDFLKQERSENEIFQLDETISMANLTIKNDGTLDDLHKEIDKLAVTILGL